MKTLRFSALVILMMANAILYAAGRNFTLTIPLKCNSYVTPVDARSKVTPHFADNIIANGYGRADDAEMIAGGWLPQYQQQMEHQVSVFFYTAYSGEMHLALQASHVPEGESVMRVKCCGKTFKLKIRSTDKQNAYYLGKVKVKHPGHVRVDIVPVKTTAQSYPSFSSLLVGGPAVGNATSKVAGKVVFVSADDLKQHVPHFVRRGPSNHFQWTLPDNAEYFYNEVRVPEGEDLDGAYYMLTGGDGFYMGIQPNKKGSSRMVLFSVWDTDTEKGLVSELVRNGAGVKTNNYSHEGSGVQNFYAYDWQSGRTYATLVRVRPEVIDGVATGASLYTGYFRGDEGWVFLAEIRRPGIQTYYTGAYSFSENFRPECGWLPRSVEFPSQWVRDAAGKWWEVLRGVFTCDGTGHQGLRRDYAGGVNDDGNFFLKNIGYIDDNVPFGTPFTRKGNGNHPDIDFKELIELSHSTDDLSKSASPEHNDAAIGRHE